jgi:multicomponent K+:H+ antiporter subunit G
MAMAAFFEIATVALLVVGASFALIGSWGLVRLPTLMERLHGPTKATTLGLGGMLVASILFFQGTQGIWTAHELLISLFLFITAPISANMIAKVHLHRLRKARGEVEMSRAGKPPLPERDIDWATYEAPRKDTPVATSES